MSKSSITISQDEIRLPPIHPGEHLADDLAEIGISIAAFARALDVPQSRIAEILDGKRSITADTALRLEAYFGGGAALWLRLQAAYDLATTRAAEGEHITAVVRRRAA